MKSIKEKSEEYGKANLTDWGVVSTERVEGFEVGANYILEQFEDIVNKNTKPNGMEDRAKMVYDMLILIKQLKK